MFVDYGALTELTADSAIDPSILFLRTDKPPLNSVELVHNITIHKVAFIKKRSLSGTGSW